MEHDLFVGVECEGRFAGIYTLFMKGSAFGRGHAVPRYNSAIAKLPRVPGHLYLGAGSTFLDWKDPEVVADVKALLDHVSQQQIAVTVESWVDDLVVMPMMVQFGCHLILRHTIKSAAPLKLDCEIKLQADNGCAIFQCYQVLNNNYLGDKGINV